MLVNMLEAEVLQAAIALADRPSATGTAVDVQLPGLFAHLPATGADSGSSTDKWLFSLQRLTYSLKSFGKGWTSRNQFCLHSTATFRACSRLIEDSPLI